MYCILRNSNVTMNRKKNPHPHSCPYHNHIRTWTSLQPSLIMTYKNFNHTIFPEPTTEKPYVWKEALSLETLEVTEPLPISATKSCLCNGLICQCLSGIYGIYFSNWWVIVFFTSKKRLNQFNKDKTTHPLVKFPLSLNKIVTWGKLFFPHSWGVSLPPHVASGVFPHLWNSNCYWFWNERQSSFMIWKPFGLCRTGSQSLFGFCTISPQTDVSNAVSFNFLSFLSLSVRH